MSLGSNIQSVHSGTSVKNVNHSIIYVADFTERTKRMQVKRHVEISSAQLLDPADTTGTTLMDSLIIHNDKNYQIEVVLLADDVFSNIITKRKHSNKHCEGCFSIMGTSSPQWVAFMELKDCSPNSKCIDKHAFSARRQIYNVVQDLRARKIIGKEKIYGIISFPQFKTSFNSIITGDDIIVATRLKKYTGVIFYGTNEAYIVSEDLIRPELK